MDFGESKTLAELVHTYIRAKDENRPHLMHEVFAQSATLEMVMKTDTIAFPPVTHGRDAITEVLVRRFGKEYENVYTFCVCQPPAAGAAEFACTWLVLMSEKESGRVRAGFGRYEWLRSSRGTPSVQRLKIVIERMDSLSADCAFETFRWARALPYPWCPVEALAARVPSEPALQAVVGRVRTLAVA